MENKTESGYFIQRIVMLESNFSRIAEAAFGPEVKNEVNINVQVNVNSKENAVLVLETVDIKQLYKDREQASFHLKYAGQFIKNGDSDIKDMEQFGKINGASIIYPYIRENITVLSMKAGLQTIILPPVNFVKMDEQQ